MTKLIAYIVIGLAILGGVVWYFTAGRLNVSTIESATTIAGDYKIESKDKVIVKNESTVTVEGNLNLAGEISCENGPLNLVVKGDVVIENKLTCNRAEDAEDVGNGITLVVAGNLTIGQDAIIASNGHVQVVANAGDLFTSEEELEKLYQETGEDTGTGPRLGPFTYENATQKVTGVSNPQVVLVENSSAFIKTANAQVPRDKDANPIPNVIISGEWVIGEGGAPPSGIDVPTPPKKVKKIILNFNFGANGNMELKDFHLVGPDGRDGKDDIDKSCSARGEKGEDAFRMRVIAQNITLNNFRLELGDGGQGGDATTKKDCDPGRATGGNGGEAGNFKMTAVGEINIISFIIVPGVGGQGGNATALGKDGKDQCPGEKGGDANATGGDGGRNKKELSAVGAVSGIGNVTISEVLGGLGGLATAEPGKGGNGTGCNCGGGKGGNATSQGGKGGDASLSIPGGTGTAKGGDGGDADSHGGTGGTGGQCPLKPKGGNGGNGGNATSKAGSAGKGTSLPGADGTVQDETGGDGGNGGDGCGPGNGGKGGQGKPPGNDGEKGKLICPEEKEKPQTSIPPPAPPPPASQSPKTKVIQYQGKYLPVDQLIIEDEVGCGAEHWHAAEGIVRATDGSLVYDPGPQCGFGKVSENPATSIDVPR